MSKPKYIFIQDITEDDKQAIHVLLSLSKRPKLPSRLGRKIDQILEQDEPLPHNWVCYEWLRNNWAHPYPTKETKLHLLSHCKGYNSLKQIDQFFSNARRRLL